MADDNAPIVNVGKIETREPELDQDAAILVAAVEMSIKSALAPVLDRLRTLETRAGDVDIIRTRLDVLEAIPAPEGPPGPPGPPGPAGADGRGFEYRGVYVQGKQYAPGDFVTVAGSLWHCDAETDTRPGDGGSAWTLAVKRGRDGAR